MVSSSQETRQQAIKTETICCDLCESEQSRQIVEGRDLLHQTPGRWSVVRCEQCGLCYTNPRPDLESLGLVYPEDYAPYKEKKRKKQSWRWRLQQWALRHHWRYPPPAVGFAGKILSWPLLVWFRGKIRREGLIAWEGQGRLLDYGCGGGGYLVRMQQMGWTVTGMDMSAQAVGVCRDQGLEVQEGIDPTEAFDPESFDAVTLWHVIEHVPSPLETLRQMNRVLKEGGRLVLVMPNFGSTFARKYGVHWYCLDLPRHLTHFERGSLQKILEKTGFQVELMRGQKHGRVFQKTAQYVGREKKGGYAWLGRRKRLCSLIERLVDSWGEPSVLMVQARKVSSGRQ